MVTKTKAKPSAKKPAAKKAPAKKPAAKKAPAKTKAPKVSNLMAVGAFAKFTGYRSPMDDDEIAFAEGTVLYVVEVEEDDDGVMYSCISSTDVADYENDPDADIAGGQVAPSEVTPLSGTALAKARESFMPITMVGRMEELFEEAGGDPITAAVHLNNSIQEGYFYMGGALASVLQSGAHLAENDGDYEGEDAWNDFCQAEFGFKASKGRQLARIYMTFSALPDFDPAQLAGIGWSLAAKAEKYVTEENVDEVLEIAASDEATQKTLDKILSDKFVVENTTPAGRAAARGPTLLRKTMTFRFDEDSAETVEMAIQQCMKQTGIASPELALEAIVVQWAGEFVGTPTAAKRIKSKANKVAKRREKAAKDSPPATPEAKPTPATKPRRRK